MDLPAVDPELAPGLHVQTDIDPLALAKQLAADLEGDLCVTRQEADDLLGELGAYPTLDADGLLLVQGLAGRVASAQRIVDRTLDRAAADVSERLAAVGSSVAVHPRAVRERAQGVVSAREALQQAEDALTDAMSNEADVEAEPAPEPVPGVADGAAEPAPVPATERPARRRWWQLGFGRRRDRRYEEDTSESTSLLQQMAASTDEAFGARRASQARTELLVLLRAQRDRAEEDVRVAERAWADLAGDAPIEDIEAVVQRFDPQHQQAREVAKDAVGVRAAEALRERAVVRWEDGWRSLGIDPPATIDHEWLERLADRVTRPVVLVTDAIQVAEILAMAAPAAPVVAVEPAS